MMRGIRVRVHLFANSCYMDCTDVRLEEVRELLNVTELTRVPRSLGSRLPLPYALSVATVALLRCRATEREE
jgi:hypothetical protein